MKASAVLSLLLPVSIVLLFAFSASAPVSAMGQAWSTCPNVYPSTVTSFVIHYTSPDGTARTYNALSAPGQNFTTGIPMTYTATFTIKAGPESYANNTSPGELWYSTTYPGYGDGVCVNAGGAPGGLGTSPMVSPGQSVTTSVTISAPPFSSVDNTTAISVTWVFGLPTSASAFQSFDYGVVWSATTSSSSSSLSTPSSSSSSSSSVVATSSSQTSMSFTSGTLTPTTTSSSSTSFLSVSTSTSSDSASSSAQSSYSQVSVSVSTTSTTSFFSGSSSTSIVSSSSSSASTTSASAVSVTTSTTTPITSSSSTSLVQSSSVASSQSSSSAFLSSSSSTSSSSDSTSSSGSSTTIPGNDILLGGVVVVVGATLTVTYILVRNRTPSTPV